MGIDLDEYSSANYEVSFQILTYNHYFIYASMVLELTDFIQNLYPQRVIQARAKLDTCAIKEEKLAEYFPWVGTN